jgi:hypothetical protein
MVDPQPRLVELLVRHVLLPREFLPQIEINAITQAFTKTAEFQFRAKGMPGHPSVVLPHPISNLTTADMRALTQCYVEQVVRHLTA